MPEVAENIQKTNAAFFTAFVACLVLFATLSLLFLPRDITGGDAPGYVSAMQVFAGGTAPVITGGFEAITTFHRMLTTELGIEALRVSSILFGSIPVGWLVWDVLLFFAVNILFYQLLLRMFKSPRVALIGGLLFSGNYAMVTMGLGFFMDIGGWFFYVASIFCLYLYIESGTYRDLLLATLAIAVGGLFKENAFIAFIPLAAILLYEDFPSPIRFLKRIVPLGALIAVPVIIHHLQIFFSYGYYYTMWVQVNQTMYHYSSRLVEYIKSLGALLTFLAPLALAGMYIFVRPSLMPSMDMKRKIYIVAVLASSIPALLWPGITERVLFMVVPGLVFFACLFVQRYERYWKAFLPIILLYVLGNFFMDSFILNYVNLPF